MYELIFLITLPLFVTAAGLIFYSLMRLARNDPNARRIMTAGLGVWLGGIVVGALVFLLA
jgi:hypothetical protein